MPERPPPGRRDDDARLAYEQCPLPQAFAELDGHLTSVNAALIRLLGRSEQWLLGRDVNAMLHPLDDPDLRGQLARLRRGQSDSISVEVVARESRGRTVPLIVDASVVRDPDGRPRGLALLARDLRTVRSAEERLAGLERLYRVLSQRAADAALVTDADLRVTFVSPALTDMLGHEALDVLSAEATSLVHPDERSLLRDVVARVAEEPDTSERALVRTRTMAGDWRWTELTVVNALADSDVGGLILNLRDVTEELEAERTVRESEARYRAIVENAQEGIVSIDAAGRIDLANQRIADILRLSAEEVSTSGRVQELLRAIRPQAADGEGRREVRYTCPDGTEKVLSISSAQLLADGEPGSLVMVSDITEAHVLQERLRHQALHDQLTELPNRYLFEDRLEMAAARQQRRPEGSTAVMYLDLDGFKEVNDTHGHTVGDRLLTLVGQRLVDTVRATDTVARLGGDEFAVVCEGLDEAGARAIAERIQEDVFGLRDYDGRLLAVGASIGIAMFPPHDPARALALADTAMYQAKRLGGGGVIVFGVDTP